MTRRTRNLLVGLTMTGLVAAGRPSMAAEVEPPAISHVRSSSPSIMALVRQAIEQSKTFGGLVDTINASDGFVYVEEGKCGHGVRSCFITVTVAGGRAHPSASW